MSVDKKVPDMTESGPAREPRQAHLERRVAQLAKGMPGIEDLRRRKSTRSPRMSWWTS